MFREISLDGAFPVSAKNKNINDNLSYTLQESEASIFYNKIK